MSHETKDVDGRGVLEWFIETRGREAGTIYVTGTTRERVYVTVGEILVLAEWARRGGAFGWPAGQPFDDMNARRAMESFGASPAKDNAVRVWAYKDAPVAYRDLCREHGGDEDWLVLIPAGISDPEWLWHLDSCGEPCEHVLSDGSRIRTGTHA